MPMFQVGDTVCYCRNRLAVPRVINGEVLSVGAKSAMVRWNKPERQILWWYRRRSRRSNDLDQSRVTFDNLELLERKGGPW